MGTISTLYPGVWTAFEDPSFIAEKMGLEETPANLKRVIDLTAADFFSANEAGFKPITDISPFLSGRDFDHRAYVVELGKLNSRSLSKVVDGFPSRLGEVCGLGHGANLAFCDADYLPSLIGARNMLVNGVLVDLDSVSPAQDFDLKKVNDVFFATRSILEFTAGKMRDVFSFDESEASIKSAFRRAYTDSFVKAGRIVLKRSKADMRSDIDRIFEQALHYEHMHGK